MRFGVHLPNSGPFASREAIASMATAAERLGYDAVLPHDHVNWGYEDRYHFYAGSREAADAADRPTDFYDAISTLAYLAGITQRVRLIPSALCLAWRDVLLFARQVLTLHQLSKGRFVLCVCVGNVRKDFEVTGTPWEERGRIATEKLRVLRMLIDEPGPLSFEGKYVGFKDAELTPRPEGLPLWWAGASSDIAIRRAARYGDGLMGGSPDYFRQKIPELRREAERVGRGDVAFQFGTETSTCIASTDEEAQSIGRKTLEAHSQGEWMQRHDASARSRRINLVGSPETVVANVREYEAAGATHLNLCFIGRSPEFILEQMEVFAREVMPRVG